SERPFRVPGGGALLKVIAYVPMILIIISIIFTAIPMSTDPETLAYFLPITIGSIASIIIGEILISRGRKRKTTGG
ncbi:MAG: amino acid:proton antiporter, partial [Oscillospiraceae bacterium]|nr:amino acid:proton antiporter [Oscillospiraceae bacterium]